MGLLVISQHGDVAIPFEHFMFYKSFINSPQIVARLTPNTSPIVLASYEDREKVDYQFEALIEAYAESKYILSQYNGLNTMDYQMEENRVFRFPKEGKE